MQSEDTVPEKSENNYTPNQIISARGNYINTLNYKNNNNKKRTNFNISKEDFLNQTTTEERKQLLQALNQSITKVLEQGRHILLEGLGIVLISEEEATKTYHIEDFTALRTERVRHLDFEKCAHFEKADDILFPNIVKTADLARLCQLCLPPELSLKWNEHLIKRMLRTSISFIRSNLIQNGTDDSLPSIGTFVALHNRQGKNESDWFAGADIFIANPFTKIISLSEPSWISRPVFKNSHELLNSAFGQDIYSLDIDLAVELEKLGFQLDNSEADLKNPLTIRAYDCGSGFKKQILWCTQGLFNSKLIKQPTELTCHITIENKDLNYFEDSTSIETVKSLFTMGWIILAGAKKSADLTGAFLSADSKLTSENFSAVMLNKFSFFPGEALSEQGGFRYLNILGLTTSEYSLAKQTTADLVLSALNHKNLANTTKIGRSSLNWYISTKQNIESQITDKEEQDQVTHYA